MSTCRLRRTPTMELRRPAIAPLRQSRPYRGTVSHRSSRDRPHRGSPPAPRRPSVPCPHPSSSPRRRNGGRRRRSARLAGGTSGLPHPHQSKTRTTSTSSSGEIAPCRCSLLHGPRVRGTQRGCRPSCGRTSWRNLALRLRKRRLVHRPHGPTRRTFPSSRLARARPPLILNASTTLTMPPPPVRLRV